MKALFFALLLSVIGTAPAEARVGDTHFGVGGPVMILESEPFWGLDFTVLHQITHNVELGGQTGFHVWTTDGATLWVLPLVPTVIYDIDAHTPTFTPFVGLGLGVAILHAAVDLGGLQGSGTAVKFDGQLHLGGKFGVEKRFFADMQLGIIDGSFAFTPSIGWFF